MTIGITSSRKFDDYSKWITDANPNITIIRLSYQADNAKDVAACDGIILSGGEDVHPKIYSKLEYLSLLDTQQINIDRDIFEVDIIKKTLEQQKPLLGICRGLQITNAVLGGTLVPDIPSIIGPKQHGKIEGVDQRHEIKLKENSFIYQLTKKQSGVVNSAHHQSADKIAANLVATAFAENNIVEALEWKEPNGKSWLLLVQWHPERISDDANFSLSIRKAFLEASKEQL